MAKTAGGPFRLLEITTGFLLGNPAVWDAFSASLSALELGEPDGLVVEHLSEAELLRLIERIAAFRPQAIFSGGSTQTVKAIASAGSLPIVAWGEAETLTGHPVSNLCGYRAPGDMQRVSLAFLQELLPEMRTVAALYDATYPPGTLALDATREACTALGLRLIVYETRTADELDRAFAAMPDDGVDAIRVMNSRFTGRRDVGVAQRALAARLPLMAYDWTTEAGGLLSYTPDFVRLAPLFAHLVAAVAGGRSPADLGIRDCPTMALALNRSSAEVLGIQIPARLMARADRIYE
ncbi:MAG: hypothetical protein NVS9B6_15590 [Candidatus Limnocylindrales bacterium]